MRWWNLDMKSNARLSSEEAGNNEETQPKSSRSRGVSVLSVHFSTDEMQKGNKDKRLPSYCLVGLFLLLALMGYTTSVIDDAMPAVVRENDAGPGFSEERAWKWLRRIVGSGPRVAGTRYHLEKTEDLIALLDEVRGSNEGVRVEWQMVSGDFWLDYRRPFVNAYSNVSNVIALLQGHGGLHGNSSSGSSVLFNCHYDSVPTSPGASDNALFCAAMVEVLYVLARSGHKFKHNIIFLFNGAEENPLQGAAGFLKHPWARGVTALINLDSAGMNCKSMLFQASDPRVVASYSRSVPKPSAQAFGEVLFSSGLVPSDTDFRIFRDLGGIFGVDIAFSKQGHVYHTRQDSLSHLEPGVMQHSGDMLLALAREIADDDQYYEKISPSSAVYWDYLNLIMFTYDDTTAFCIDLAIIIFAIASVYYYCLIVGPRQSTAIELFLTILGRCLSLLVGVGTVYVLMALMFHTTPQLRYLSHSWIVVPVFWIPFLISSVALAQEYDFAHSQKWGLNTSRRVAQSMAATRSILILLSTILLCLPNTATARYIITIPLMFMSISSVISLYVMTRRNLGALQHLTLELSLATPALLLFFVVSVKVNTLMLPIMGRSPIDKPDFIVGWLNILCVVLTCLPLSGLEILFSRRRQWIVLLICLLPCLVICFVSLTPYRESEKYPALQRHYWFHSEIKTFDQNLSLVSQKSGIWFARTDVNTAQAVRDLSNVAHLTVTELTCDNETLFCGLPTLYPRMTENAPRSLWAEFEPPAKSNSPTEFNLLNRKCVGKECVLSFSFTGPPHMSISMVPINSNLTSWSLSAPVTPSLFRGKSPVYFIYWTRGTFTDNGEPIKFSITLQVSESTNTTSPIVEVSFNAHRISHSEEFTVSYDNLLKLMPDYANVATYLANRFDYFF